MKNTIRPLLCFSFLSIVLFFCTSVSADPHNPPPYQDGIFETSYEGIDGYTWTIGFNEKTKTRGLSRAEVEDLLASNNAYAGYRYASLAEVDLLFKSLFPQKIEYDSQGRDEIEGGSLPDWNLFSHITYNNSHSNFDSNYTFKELSFYFGSPEDIANYHTSEGKQATFLGHFSFYDFESDPDSGFIYQHRYDALSFDSYHKNTASLLVKVPESQLMPVPEPHTSFTFLIGLLSLSFLQRKK